MSYWYRFHQWAWWVRCPLKLAAFATVTTLVLYPKIWLLPRSLARLRNLDSTIQPGHAELAELETAVQHRMDDHADPDDLLNVVERVVCQRIPYAWDWDVWGVMDYLPTTAEVFEKGREDCDGRAVVAASLLRRMGQEAWLASDLKHVWVVTPSGETMSPGTGERTIQAGPEGTRLRVTVGTLVNLSRGLTFGITVFPLTRELLILAALCAVTAHPRSSSVRRWMGCVLMVAALGLLHDAGRTPTGPGWLAWVGWIAALAGWLVLAIRAGDPRSHPGRPE